MAIAIILPSSPKRETKSLYARLTGWLSGSKLASVLEKRMFFHCMAIKIVKRNTPIRIVILFLRIILAVVAQKFWVLNPIMRFF